MDGAGVKAPSSTAFLYAPTMPGPTEPPATPRRGFWPVLNVLVGVTALVFFSAWGGPHDADTGVIVVAERLVFASGPAALYLLAAFGLGRVFTRAMMPRASAPSSLSTSRAPLQLGIGLAILLFLSHAFAAAGWFAGTRGSWLALGVVLAGALLAIDQFIRFTLRKSPRQPAALPWLGPLAAVAIAILLVAAANPPGWLWGTEFGGYDALSYHLQLPQEWLASGRLRPVPHNVYSFLPSFVEAAFMHVGAMTFAPAATPTSAGGLLAGDGHRLIACQFLHAFIAVAAAWITGRAAAAFLPGDHPHRHAVAVIAAALVLATPWCVVTGSLGYNDMAVCALFAAGLLAAVDPALTPARRGAVVGLIAAAACGVKPTALFFVALPLGLFLLARMPWRAWPRSILAGTAVGVAVLGIWLWHNFTVTHNPVFPFAASLFPNTAGGSGHWTAEQVARHAGAHRFDGGLLARLRTLISTDRGVFHPQWFAFFPTLPLVVPVAFTLRKRTNHTPSPLVSLLILTLLMQLVLWLFATHLQSRFLLPMIVPGAILIAVTLASLRLGYALAGVVVLTQLVALAVTFTTERGGHPNALLATGIARHTGAALREAIQRGEPAWLEHAWPDEYINAVLPPGPVYCLGGATPLYLRAGTIYNTTWDQWPFAAAPAADLNRHLRALGVSYALIDLSEIRRLNRSGWADPAATEAAVAAWMGGHTRLVRAWPEAGIFLVDLREDAP